MEERLQKVLAGAGVGSRRRCEDIIAAGRVAVNGQIITELGTKADPQRDAITVDGKPIGPPADKVYVLLNKPRGYTSTRSDPHAEKTVMELVKSIDAFLYPVGRLDVDTAGLLILTNDGEFTKLMSHPSHRVEKTYVAVVRGRIKSADMHVLEDGVELEDGITAPARTRLLAYSAKDNTSTVEVVIREGRKRQVRRMFSTVGYHVLSLMRTKIGKLDLTNLREGDSRLLTKREVSDLRKTADRSPANSAISRRNG
ncbi:MAG: rRNA pseudouridine synthase [Armatimonadetes bacterium]|jgi:pseudouridine synthase|nr:rRNA pseudouridine synthase [Armatimonadota bacterium]